MGTARTEERATIAGRSLEYRWVGPESVRAPLVFIHEGLGSIDLWREFPESLCAAAGRRGLIYSRYGNGWSEVLKESRRPDYMHDEGKVVLPEVIETLVDRTPILVGHSDGASIALIFAGAGHAVEGMVLIAPHVFVEDRSLVAIGATLEEFHTTDLATRMAKYHRDPEATFRGWNDIWLHPSFREWNIEEFLATVECPMLLIQGEDDEYGTMAQLESIESQVSGPTKRLLFKEAGHSPHLACPVPVTEAAIAFLAELP
ncbi:MAG TPA: alpha/beta hydrolase [Acidimicrobiia bacterium]|nr:alpha/beta hydrolase [Acidimicrobiia bacterium]